MYLTNHSISNLISKINYGVQKRLRFLNIQLDYVTLKLLHMLYTNGVIRSYRILDDRRVSIYFKYFLCNKVFKISIVSKPGNRIYWSVNKLLKNYNKNNFSGFYIISTQKGLYTSNKCILEDHISGEILLKIEV